MGNVIFRVMTEKEDTNGYSPVFLFYRYNGKLVKFQTKEKCPTTQKDQPCLDKYWDDGLVPGKGDKEIRTHSGKFKRVFPNWQLANEYLESLATKIKEAHRVYLLKGILPSPEMLKNELIPEQPQPAVPEVKKLDLVECWNDFIESAKSKRRAYNTVRNYATCRNHMEHWQKMTGKKIDVENYTLKLHDQILQYFIDDLEDSPNTVWSFCKNLKVFFKFLDEEREMKLNPAWKKIKASYVDVPKIFLTSDEMKKWKEVELKENLEHVRDVYWLACNTGLPYAELEELHPGHVLQRGAYTVVSMPRKKTQAKGGWIEVALNREALQVIERYKGQYEKCLPVIVNQKMNVHLKTIGKLAGIDAPTNKIVFENGRAVNKIVPKYELITTHTARHTFATQSLMKNPPIPIEVLQRILGHSKIKDTLVYAKIVREFQHEIMMKTWG